MEGLDDVAREEFDPRNVRHRVPKAPALALLRVARYGNAVAERQAGNDYPAGAQGVEEGKAG